MESPEQKPVDGRRVDAETDDGRRIRRLQEALRAEAAAFARWRRALIALEEAARHD
jgi:hypothetical protein